MAKCVECILVDEIPHGRSARDAGGKEKESLTRRPRYPKHIQYSMEKGQVIAMVIGELESRSDSYTE